MKRNTDWAYNVVWALYILVAGWFAVSCLTGCAQPEIICDEREFMDMGNGGAWRCRHWSQNPNAHPSPSASQGPQGGGK